MHQRIRGPRVVAARAVGDSGLDGARRMRFEQFFLEPGRRHAAQADVHRLAQGHERQPELAVTVDPSGSTTLSGPITLSFGGPFQSLGTAASCPQSDFTVSVSALGKSGSLGSCLDRHSRLRHASGHQLPAAGGDVPEARVELRRSRRRRAAAAARARSRSSASSRCTGSATRRSSAPRASAAPTRRTSRASVNVAALLTTSTRSCQGLDARRLRRQRSCRRGSRRRPAARSPARSRTRSVRRLDRQQRQDAAQADDRADGARHRRQLRRCSAGSARPTSG